MLNGGSVGQQNVYKSNQGRREEVIKAQRWSD